MSETVSRYLEFIAGALLAAVLIVGVDALANGNEIVDTMRIGRLEVSDGRGETRMVIGKLRPSEASGHRDVYGVVIYDKNGYVQFYAKGIEPKAGVVGISRDRYGFDSLTIGGNPDKGFITSSGTYRWSMARDEESADVVVSGSGRAIRMTALSDRAAVYLTELGKTQTVATSEGEGREGEGR